MSLTDASTATRHTSSLSSGGLEPSIRTHALGVPAPDVDDLVQDHEGPMPHVSLFQEGRIVVQPPKIIDSHRAQPRPLHGYDA